jgi:hypothetical protein
MARKRRKRKGASDRGRIALSQSYEVRYWSKKFNVTPAELKAAVKAAGHSANRVGTYIARKKKAKRKKKTKKKASRKKRL